MTKFNLKEIPRVEICTLPTPIQFMKQLSKHLGKIAIYFKRDDLTGVALGGNKNRKLEYLLADALKKKADTVITEGAITSNHCLQTAACAAKVGLKCELVLSDAFIGDEKVTGNLLLDHILDVKIHRVEKSSERKMKMEEVANNLHQEGKNPYIIPTGGSNKIGIIGYINFMREIALQSKQLGVKFDYLILASGSAGTQAGILAGKELFYPDIKVIGFSAGDNKKEIISATLEILREFEEENSLTLDVKNSEVVVFDEYFGEGYGIPSEKLISTTKLIAKLEGIFLDPVYNGKAMIGLIDLIEKRYFADDSIILYLHTGGYPALFSYSKYFT